MDILQYAGNVTVQVGIMFLLILIGFAATKQKWIDGSGVPQMVNLLFYVVTPAVIINAFLSVEFTKEKAFSLIEMAGCAILVHMVGFIVSRLCFSKEEPFRKPVLQLGVIFSNCGFMSLPLAAALLKTDGVFYVSVYVVLHNIIIWTLGLGLFKNAKISLKKAFLNPGTIGVMIGLPLFLLKIQLPELIFKPVSYMADLNTPLAMLVIGYYLACTTFRIKEGDGKLLYSMLLRLVAVPAVALLIFWALPIKADVFAACMIPASAPAAANVPMFAAMFGSDVDAGSRIVSVSTVLSIITIPVFMSLAQMLA